MWKFICTIALPMVAAGITGASQTQAPASGPVPTWTKDVGPILSSRCMTCHRPGEIAPMSLLSYKQARPWARSIKNQVVARHMPPWHADPHYGKFSNDRRLTDQEIQTIVRWVDGGAPKGEGEFRAPEFPPGWQLKPDIIIQMAEEYTVPANGPDLNLTIEVPTNLKEDVWVTAVEVRGNPRVVHHNVVSVLDPQGQRDPTGRLAAYTPGKQYDNFGTEAAKLVRAGSILSYSMHYHPSDKEEKDRSSVGLVLARKPVKYQIYSRAVADVNINIPPYEPNYLSQAEFEFPIDGEITLFKPHMHWRGKDMTYIAVFPDGKEEILMFVPKYDMNWQISYELETPKSVPKGSKLKVVSHFDNSENNPWNPNPSVRVINGNDSRDEMMEGWFDYRVKMDKVVVPKSAMSAGSGRQP